MADETRAEWLPSGWVKHHENSKGGSKAECYKNLETGQIFHSNKDLLQYDAYATKILPLINEGKLSYEYFLKKSKGKAAAENSSVFAVPADVKAQEGKAKGKRKAAAENSFVFAVPADVKPQEGKAKGKGKAVAENSSVFAVSADVKPLDYPQGKAKGKGKEKVIGRIGKK